MRCHAGWSSCDWLSWSWPQSVQFVSSFCYQGLQANKWNSSTLRPTDIRSGSLVWPTVPMARSYQLPWISTCVFGKPEQSNAQISRLTSISVLTLSASVSKVMVDSNNIAISGSYDRSLLIWDLNKGSCEAGLFDGHDDAVMTFDWRNSLCVSADRKGGVSVWDINSAKPVSITKPHKVNWLIL